MTDTRVSELFPRETPSTLFDLISSRLPQKEIITVSDVCVAADVDKETVYAWIDEGRFEFFDASSGPTEKPYWKIWRTSFLRFIQQRIAGA